MINYKLDCPNTIKISDKREVIYTISKKHRGKKKQKSYWIIKKPEEVSLFIDSLKSGYEDENKYCAWNLRIIDGNAVVLGCSLAKEELKIAKFINSAKKDQWHGYPANYIKKSQDIPSAKILTLWHIKGLINTATMKKIRGGQPCNL